MTLASVYPRLDAHDLAALVRQGQISEREVVEAAYLAIEAVNPCLNAFVSLERDLVERDLATGLGDGPFRGVPMAMKDCAGLVAGVPRNFGSRLARGSPIHDESEVLARHRRAGFCFVGTTNVPEFSSNVTTEPVLYGPVHNPWLPGRSAGGSSGGAAAAVAAGLVPIAYANDGTGSIRIPASCCGLFGLKTSRGRIPTGPHKNDFWHGLMIHHVLTRSVRDSALAVDVTAGLDAGAPYSAPPLRRPLVEELGAPVAGTRIAVSLEAPNGALVHADCRQAVLRAIPVLESMGCIVEEARPDYDGAELCAQVTDLIAISLARDLPEFSRLRHRPIGPETVELCNLALAERGARLSAVHLQGLLYEFGALGRQVGRFFERGYDVLLTPTLARPPLRHGELDANSPDLEGFLRTFWGFTPFTPLANVAGTPAMSVPMHWNAEGLPVGVMFMAAYGEEATLIRIACQLEIAQPWGARRPPVSAANPPPARHTRQPSEPR